MSSNYIKLFGQCILHSGWDNKKKNSMDMMSLDIFLSSLSKERYQAIKHQLNKGNNEQHPLLSWDITGMHTECIVKKATKLDELNELKKLYKLFNWRTDLEDILSNDYYALVLTDLTATVQWVNSNFKTMTGYSGKYMIGKSPRILQGKNTSPVSRKNIRSKLFTGQPFQESITNYRKNKEEYRCLVTIYPLKNSQNSITHFLALEKEVIL